jgi:hypothetical protein
MRRMTRARARTNWGGIPSLSQPLLAAALRLLAERVRHAASILWMACVRLSRDWHTDAAPAGLPGGKNGIAQKEQQQQEQHVDADAGARTAAVIVAAGVAGARATRAARALSVDPLIQKDKLPAEPAEPAEPAAPEAATTSSNMSARLRELSSRLAARRALAGTTAMGCSRTRLPNAPV